MTARAIRYDGDVVEAVTALSGLLRGAGIPTSVSVPESPLHVASATAQILTETAIQSVSNIIKHAPKSRAARVELRDLSDHLELIVSNTAPTFSARAAPSAGGRGLTRARQRLEHHGGQLEAGLTNAGWVLRATVPAGETT